MSQTPNSSTPKKTTTEPELSKDAQGSHLAHPTPRRAHPALHVNRQYQKGDPQQTIRAPRASTLTPQKQTAFDISGSPSPEGIHDSGPNQWDTKIDHDAAQRKETNRSSPTPSTPSNVSAGYIGGGSSSKSKSKSAALRRARQRSRRSLKGYHSDDESSDSGRDEESRQERRFEEAFKKFDPNRNDHISVSDFLHFFDTLQASLPPLSDPLLNPEAREMALGFMSSANDQVLISRADLKRFYKEFTGKSLVQNMTEEASDSNQDIMTNTSFQEKELFDAVGAVDDLPETWNPITSPGRRTHHGSLFQRPPGPKRRGTSMTSSDYSDIEEGGRGFSDSETGPLDITGLPLASSTPNPRRITSGRGGMMSPTLMSPTHASPSANDLAFSHSRQTSLSQHGRGSQFRQQHGSPWSDTETDLEETQKNLERELKNRDALEAEVSELRTRIQGQQQDHDEELLACNEEIERLGKEIEGKRKEIEQLKAKTEKLDNELFVFTSETYRAKEEVARYQQQHEEDREHIQGLTADNAKLVQQNSDSNRRIEMLTADLRKVMSDREVALAEKLSVQKKADLVSEMGRQMKSLNELMKDRDVEIERLKAECERRQLDLEAMTHNANMPLGGNTADSGTRGRESGRGFTHLLSDELMDAASDETDEDGERSASEDRTSDGEEDEEIITTVKRTRRKKRMVTSKGIGGDNEEIHESSTSYREMSDRGTQFHQDICDAGTCTDPIPVADSTNSSSQTTIAIDASISLEDYVRLTLPPSSRQSAAILEKLSKAEAALRERTFTPEQMEELRDQLGIQSEVFKKFTMFMEESALSKHPARDRGVSKSSSQPLANAMVWVWKWLGVQLRRKTVLGGVLDKGGWYAESFEKDEVYLREQPAPSTPEVLIMALLFFMVFTMFVLTVQLSVTANRQEILFRKANSFGLDGGYRRGFLDEWGGRRWKHLQFQLQRGYGGDRKIPV